MSHRKAKRIRQWLRFSHVDVREARYALVRNTNKWTPGTIVLKDGCTRAMYKDMKRHQQVPA